MRSHRIVLIAGLTLVVWAVIASGSTTAGIWIGFGLLLAAAMFAPGSRS